MYFCLLCFILPCFLIIIALSSTDLKKVSQFKRPSKKVEVDDKSSQNMPDSQNNCSNKQNEGC